jgi:hypothetical protein
MLLTGHHRVCSILHTLALRKKLVELPIRAADYRAGGSPARVQRRRRQSRSIELTRLVIPRSLGAPPPASSYSRRSRSEAVLTFPSAGGAPFIVPDARRPGDATRTSSAPGMRNDAPLRTAFEMTAAVVSAGVGRPESTLKQV